MIDLRGMSKADSEVELRAQLEVMEPGGESVQVDILSGGVTYSHEELERRVAERVAELRKERGS